MRLSALSLGSILIVAALSGCISDTRQVVPEVELPAWSMELPITMNVVLVGFDGRLDPEKMRPGLIESRPVYNLQELGVTRSVNLEPIQYKLDWQFHTASDEFAQAFFSAAKEYSFEGPAPQFLVDYDKTSGENRLKHGPLEDFPSGTPITPVTQKMLYVDAPKLEAWVAKNRTTFGLGFEGAQYTVFLVDSYTKGYLPKDNYHYYYFDDGTIDADLSTAKSHDALDDLMAPQDFHTPKDPTSNRGWGGKWDFAWIDVGAAPSWLDYTPWVPAFPDDNVDHPIWDLDGQDAKLHRNLARHLTDFALVKIVRTPIYDFEYKPKWAFPVHVFVESAAISGKNTPMYGVDVEEWLIPERIEKAFEDVAPWIDTEVSVKFHYIPQDDPEMGQAVEKSKIYGNPTVSSAGVIKQHIRENWDKYVPRYGSDTRVFPQFMFFFDGLYTFWGYNQGGGFADTDAWGRSWVAFNHIFDVCAKTEQVPCTKATKWQGKGSMDLLVIHEGGHHIGFTHARDTGVLSDDGFTDSYAANWFWDSVWSVMTYRHQNPGFDRYDKDAIARGHVSWILPMVVKKLEALPEDATETRIARTGIEQTEQLLRDGKWREAAENAISTWETIKRTSGELLPNSASLRVVEFGATELVPISLGAARTPLPAEPPFAFPPENPPVGIWTKTFALQEGAKYIHLSFKDTRRDTGVLRAAMLYIVAPDGSYAGGIADDVFAEAYITGIRWLGNYDVYLVTNGGVASEYEISVDVGYG